MTSNTDVTQSQALAEALQWVAESTRQALAEFDSAGLPSDKPLRPRLVAAVSAAEELAAEAKALAAGLNPEE